MKQTIYIDVLMAVNIFVNYFLLLAVARFLKISAGRLRLVAGAVLGAVYSLVILLPPLAPWFSLLVKLFMSATIVLLAFPVHTVWAFLRDVACFYLTSFAFAGLMLALWYLMPTSGMVLNNSAVYFNISPLLLLVMTVLCYGLVRLMNRITGQQQPAESFCRIQIWAGEACVTIPTKIDTGNSLTEPFSGFPVVVAEFSSVDKILPEGIRDYLCAAAGKTAAEPDKGFRFVPFNAVGGSGILPAFRPDRVVIQTIKAKITVTDVYLAVCVGRLTDGRFQALLNPQLLTQGEQTDRKGKEAL